MKFPRRRVYGRGGNGVAPRLGIAGEFFTDAGQPFTVIETSEFSLFKRYLDHDAVVPVEAILAQRQAIGFNTLRVWLLNNSVVAVRNSTPEDGIHPDQYPDFYDRLGPFVDLCGRYGFAVELTVFTGAGSLMPRRDRQQRHLDRTADAVRGRGNVLIELVNEGDQYDNAPDANLTRPAGVLISRGSNGSDSVPPRHDSPWDYELYHSNDLNEFQRKVGHNAMEWAEQSGKPCVSNENTRYADRDNSEVHAFDAAAGAALLCAGSCFHSQGGKFSQLFSDREIACARAWVAGARSVPLEFQRGAYRRHDELNGPDCIRAYTRTLPDGRAHLLRIRP